jgi:hypothetical protein
LTQVNNEAMDPLEPVNRVVPAIPMHVGKAIEQAMSLDAQHRFSSVEQFWETLWLVLADHPTPVLGKPSVPQGSPAVPAPEIEQAVGQTIEKQVPEPSPVVPASVEEQEAKTIRLASLPQLYLKRWLSYQSLKNNNDSGQSQRSSPPPSKGDAPIQPISSLEEMAPERPAEKSVPQPEDSSPIEPLVLKVTDVSTQAQIAQRPLSEQNGRIDQGSLWPCMDIEMSFSQSDWEWSVSSKPEHDRQEE